MGGGIKALREIPKLGAGLGYRREIAEAILATRDAVDFLEIVTEQFLTGGDRRKELERICDEFTVIPHGVSLSVASPWQEPEYLRALKWISDATAAPYYSEHLALTRAPGIDLGHLSPVWLNAEALQIAADNANRVQDLLQKPLVLENITYGFAIPGGSMPQAEFLSRLVDLTGCGLLLDLANLHINSVNHRFDPYAFMRALPLDHVVQVHLAGGIEVDGYLIDSHSEAVASETWALFEWLVSATDIRGSILEHDVDFPADASALFEQVAQARRLMAGQRMPQECAAS